MYYCCGITDKGVMKHNEDAFMIGKKVMSSGSVDFMMSAPLIAAVSDGVSGENSGELASFKCLEFLSDLDFNSASDLKKEVMNVHNQLSALGTMDSSTHNIYTINVGDSRMYRYRGGDIRQISKDQSLVQMLYDEGSISEAEKRTHIHKNIIFPVMGNTSSKPKPDITNLNDVMKYGDVILICSDGLSDYVSCTEMEDILALPAKLPRRLERLVKLAIENGSSDNITITALCCYD